MMWTLFSKLYSDCHWYQLCFVFIKTRSSHVRMSVTLFFTNILWSDLEEYLLALIAHNVDIWTEEAMDINYVTHTEWCSWILAWSTSTIRETLLPFIVSTLRPLPVNKIKEIYSTNSCVELCWHKQLTRSLCKWCT